MLLMGMLMLLQGSDPLGEADKLFGLEKYVEAVVLYRKCGDASVEALAQIARCMSLVGKLDEGRGWLARAAKLATEQDPPGWSRFLGVRGIFERESGDKGKAKATFEEMYAYCEKRQLWRRAIDAAHHVAIVGTPEEQLAWGRKGIAAAEKLGDESWLAVLWNNLAATYEDRKQVDMMLEAYLKAQTYHHKTGTPRKKMIADWAVGHGYRLTGDLEQARKLLQITLREAERQHEMEKSKESVEWVGWCKKDLGETLAASGERRKGLDLLREGRAALVESGIETWWPDGLKALDKSMQILESGK
jgi:tetratricopeptide (TPR) repeat protein